MKLTVGYGRREGGFALPTILLVSTVMLIILTASIAATAASRVSLDSQYYNQLAEQAAQSGMARANECLRGNGYAPQWSTVAGARDLRPNSDCTGATMVGSFVSPYVVGTAGATPSKVRTLYSVEAPSGTGVGSILRIVGKTELVRTSAPNNVWRSYEQSLYLRIEPLKSVSCPEGFISVPGDARFNTSDFCAGKYEAKNVGGKAVSQAAGLPWSLNQVEAMAAAEGACTGCSLISEAQWLTIAHNVTSVSSNWTGGSVGSGVMNVGHSDGSPANVLGASSDDNDGYFGTGDTSPSSQRRTLRLNNGETIWDLAGNNYEWTSGQIAADKPGASGLGWREWNTIPDSSVWAPNPLPSYATPGAGAWTSALGIGRLYSDSGDATPRGIMRGANYNGGANSGVFTAALHVAPTGGSVAFRVVYEPLSSIRCPEGYVPVPGNSTFGTKNFCAGKYEAKDFGGKAVSQAAGLPWVNISQIDAITAANNACVSCRLMGEAEWLTIAHNVVNVPSNWSTGTVGSGYIYSGHNDSSPNANQAASANDSDGYYGTSNSSGAQRRTLTLNNGQVLWDIAGNVSEWTTATMTGGQPGPAAWAWREWNAISGGTFNVDPYPVNGTSAASAWTSVNGIGRVNTNSADATMKQFLRGGGRTSGANAGIFSLNLNAPATAADVGFRIITDPLPSVSCSDGMIRVPGDIRFGTTDFCAGKYEAKNVGGKAISQAAGTPWVSINQTNAAIASNAACAKCRLIGEAEWLTIAHNVVNVPSNWSTGTVGSGYVYSGHGDNGPATSLAASTNDADGYFGTGQSTGNQRRTLSLSNGEVIWDLAGNVYEWTSAQISGSQPGAAGWVWREWNTVTNTNTLIPSPFPGVGTPAASGWTSSNGIGRFYSNSSDATLRGYRRGGYWYNDGTAGNTGVFQLALNLLPTDTATALGFRFVEIK